MSTMAQNFALIVYKPSSFMYQIEISEILVCFMLTVNIAATLPVGAFWQLMPSVGILVYEMEQLF
jgi:hypothetical protein